MSKESSGVWDWGISGPSKLGETGPRTWLKPGREGERASVVWADVRVSQDALRTPARWGKTGACRIDKGSPGEFPGGPVVNTLWFHCRRCEVSVLARELRSYLLGGMAK